MATTTTMTTRRLEAIKQIENVRKQALERVEKIEQEVVSAYETLKKAVKQETQRFEQQWTPPVNTKRAKFATSPPPPTSPPPSADNNNYEGAVQEAVENVLGEKTLFFKL